MKKLITFLLLLTAGATQLFAQAPKSSLLWEISGNGLKTPSYLFGTFHIMCQSDFVISDALKNKIKNAKQFYGELKMDDFAGMQMEMAMKMIMKDKTIESMMTPAEFKQVSSSFQKITGMPFSLFNSMKPFMSQSLLAVKMIDCKEQIQPETEFAKIAGDQKIPIFGLEKMDDQLSAIDKIPLDSQVRDLKRMLLNFDSARRDMYKMIAVYKKRNIDSVYGFIAKDMSGSSFEKDLIIQRNKNWMPGITKAIADKQTFFAVGAGHLGGTNGLIRLLRKQGYKLTPVTY